MKIQTFGLLLNDKRDGERDHLFTVYNIHNITCFTNQ